MLQLTRSLVALVAIGTVSCTASMDLDRFHKQEATQAIDLANITYLDFRYNARNMLPHVGETLEIRLVDKTNAVQGKGVFANVPRPDFKLEFAAFVPKANGPYRIDFWADHNASKRYDGIEGGINDKDHAWRRVLGDPLPEDVQLVDARYDLSFIHDTAFVDIFTDLDGNKISGDDTLLPFKLAVAHADAYPNKSIEIRVRDKASGRLVALHRQGFPTASYTAEVTGVLDEETPYEVAVFVDVDGVDEYRATAPSWRMDLVSSELGIVADLDLATAPQTPLGDTR